MPEPVSGLTKIPVDSIKVGSHREDLGDIASLAKSIKDNGLINAIVVDRKEIKINPNETINEYWLTSGYRRLVAIKQLGWKEVEVRLYENLSEFERKQVELEEELAQKKMRTWQEEVEIKRQLHELFMQEKGGDAKRKGSHGTKVWSQADTAERIGIPSSSLSEDLRLAEALKQFPELLKAGTKKDALRKMYSLRELALLQSISRKMRDLGAEMEEDVQLKHGDAYKLLKQLPDESFDCCITDPPWGIEIQKAGSARSNEYIEFKDSADVWKEFLKKGLPELFRVLREGSHMWLFFGPEYYQCTRDALEEVGFDVRYVPCIWIKEKPNYTDVEYKPMPMYETFFFCVRRKNKELAPRRLNEAVADVFNYPRIQTGRIHRTEKPIDLIKRLISLSTEKGDRILDPFAGSASTLCAALRTQRKALGFELDKDMCEAANGKLQALKVEIDSEED